MQLLNEAMRIDGITPEMQHEFDKLAAYFAVFKSRTRVNSPRYITKLNEFQLKFLDFLDRCDTEKAKMQVGTFIKEIRALIAAKQNKTLIPPKNTVIAGGKIRELPKKVPPKKVEDEDDWEYANPKNGGSYYDDDVAVYEAPADDDDMPDEDVVALKKLRKKGYRVTR